MISDHVQATGHDSINELQLSSNVQSFNLDQLQNRTEGKADEGSSENSGIAGSVNAAQWLWELGFNSLL